MAPVATPFFFYLLSGIMLIGGILVITRKNPVHSALALIVTLLAQASIYLMLYAPFVAGVQIILYAGGIMVLFLFVIMLVSIERVQRRRGDCPRQSPPRRLCSAVWTSASDPRLRAFRSSKPSGLAPSI